MQKIFFHFLWFKKNKKWKKIFFPKLHDNFDAFSSIFAEFHLVFYLKNGNCENMFVCIFIFEKLHFAIVLLCCCVLKMEAVIFLHFSKS